jgi:FecR protein
MATQRFSLSTVAVALFVCALLAAPLSYADSYARIVRLSDIGGTVEIDRNTGSGFEKALLNMPVTQGVQLKTGPSARAEVEFENGSVLRLVNDTAVEFSKLSLGDKGDRLSEIHVNRGMVYIDFRHKGGENFRIAAGNRVFDLTHEVRFRLRMDDGEAQLAVFKGEVDVQEAAETAKVKKNQTLTFDLNDSGKFELAKEITPFPTDDYDRQRAQYLQQYASSSHGSPYSYGYSDLYRYGSFYSLPGYGLVWQPAGFGPGWDPYSSGYWSYYSGPGYVWVSSYPWGWAPYRYGQWTFINGRGWLWRPGNWNNWNTGVAVTNAPPTWRRPIPPASGVIATVPVGNPVQVRTIPPSFGSRRIDRMNPAAPGLGPTDRAQTRPATSTATPAANAAVAQPQPTSAKPVAQPPANLNRPVRDVGMDPHHGRAGPATGAATRQQSAPHPTMQSRPMSSPPMRSAPAAPRATRPNK